MIVIRHGDTNDIFEMLWWCNHNVSLGMIDWSHEWSYHSSNYYGEFRFKNEEDAIVFKLKFSL